METISVKWKTIPERHVLFKDCKSLAIHTVIPVCIPILIHVLLHRLCTEVALNNDIQILLTLSFSVRPLYTGLCGGEYSYYVARLCNTGA